MDSERVTASEALAASVAGASAKTLPGDVRERVKDLVIDSLGVALAAVNLESSRAIRRAMEALEDPEHSRMLGSNVRVSAANAALANGTIIHALDFDDTHLPAQVHVCGSVVPAVLSAAERHGASGKDILVALACGMEVAVRIGMAAPARFNKRGFHATGVCGAFGAAAGVAKILGLDATGVTNALGIVGSQAAGITAFIDDPDCWVKRMHSGWAAHCGYYSAFMASKGFTGPNSVLDGRFNLYLTHVDGGYDLSGLSQPFDRWEAARIGLKPYPVGQYNIPFMTAIQTLLSTGAFGIGDIAAIRCHITEHAVQIVCEPLDVLRRPSSGYAAKFSLPVSIAVMAVKGRATLQDFSDETIRDPRIHAVADMVEYVVDLDAAFPRYYPGKMEVRLNDGRTFTHFEPINLGHPENPLPRAKVIEKFQGCAETNLRPEQSAEFLDIILTLDERSSADVTRLLEITSPSS